MADTTDVGTREAQAVNPLLMLVVLAGTQLMVLMIRRGRVDPQAAPPPMA